MNKFLVSLAMLVIPLISWGQDLIPMREAIRIHELLNESYNKPDDQAHTAYYRNKPEIDSIAARYGYEVYEFHGTNGTEKSTYGCQLYKNCSVRSRGEYGAKFRPSSSVNSSVVDRNGLTVYSKKTFDALKADCAALEGFKHILDKSTFDPLDYYTNGVYDLVPGDWSTVTESYNFNIGKHIEL